MEILSNFRNVKSPCANLKPPIENFLATVMFEPHILSRDAFVAVDSSILNNLKK